MSPYPRIEVSLASFYDIMILTGPNPDDAQSMSDHFVSLTTLHQSPLSRHIEGPEGWWWINLLPKGVGYGVSYDRGYFIESHAECLRIVREIYEHIRTAPPFVCALAGWEIEDRLFDLEDAEYVWEHESVRINGILVDNPGAVVPITWWKKMQRMEDYDSESFEPFREGLVWSPDLGITLKAYGRK